MFIKKREDGMPRNDYKKGVIMFLPPLFTISSFIVCALKILFIITGNQFWCDFFSFISFADLFVIFIVSLISRELLILIRR